MGRNKAAIEVDGVPMGRRVAAVLAAAEAHPVVLIGGDRAELDVLGYDVVADRHPGEGPLGGVITALEYFSEADDEALVAVVACDLPRLHAAVVGELFTALGDHPDADVAMARTERRESAVAVWRPSACPALANVFAAGTRAVHEAVDALTVVDVTVAADALVNVNDPEQLRALTLDDGSA